MTGEPEPDPAKPIPAVVLAEPSHVTSEPDKYAGVCTEDGTPYSMLSLADLSVRFNSLNKKKDDLSPEHATKLAAAKFYIDAKRA